MKQQEDQPELLRLFEGSGISSPSGKRCFAKLINGKLLIPFSTSEDNKLAGHYFNSRIIGNMLICRFERFEPYAAGIMLLKLGENRTLKGGWWPDEKLSDSIKNAPYQINENVPGMVGCVWVPPPKGPIPIWAKEYFHKDSTDQG